MTHPRDERPQAPAPNNGAITIARIKSGAGVLALAALALFLLQNLQEVDVHFLWFDWSTRMTWALLASAAFGGIGAVLIGTLARRRHDD
jgi:uncharacterized integral membrane protein